MRQNGRQHRAPTHASDACFNAGEALGREGNEPPLESRPKDTSWYVAMLRNIFQGSVGSTQPRGLISRTRKPVPLGSLRTDRRPKREENSTGSRVSRFIEDFSTPEIDRLSSGSPLQPTQTKWSLDRELPPGAEHGDRLSAQEDHPPLGSLARGGVTVHETIPEEPDSETSNKSDGGGEGSASARLPVQSPTRPQKPR